MVRMSMILGALHMDRVWETHFNRTIDSTFDQLFKSVDTNGDGYIVYEEFDDFWSLVERDWSDVECHWKSESAVNLPLILYGVIFNVITSCDDVLNDMSMKDIVCEDYLVTSTIRSNIGFITRTGYFARFDTNCDGKLTVDEWLAGFRKLEMKKDDFIKAVSYTHLTLPTNREV